MNEVPTVEESMAKIGAPAWTSHGYSCRREREILAELVQAEVNHSKESPGRAELHGCGTWLLYAAHDRFIGGRDCKIRKSGKIVRSKWLANAFC